MISHVWNSSTAEQSQLEVHSLVFLLFCFFFDGFLSESSCRCVYSDKGPVPKWRMSLMQRFTQYTLSYQSHLYKRCWIIFNITVDIVFTWAVRLWKQWPYYCMHSWRFHMQHCSVDISEARQHRNCSVEEQTHNVLFESAEVSSKSTHYPRTHLCTMSSIMRERRREQYNAIWGKKRKHTHTPWK